jgi:hypothetical protein
MAYAESAATAATEANRKRLATALHRRTRHVNLSGPESLSDEEPIFLTNEDAGTPTASGYVVLREVETGHWVVVGDTDRRPGLTARNSRVQAVKDAIGREPAEGEVYAALPRSEWRVARQL